MSKLKALVAVAAFVVGSVCFAGTHVLGLELGVSTLAQVKERIPQRSSVRIGTHQMIGGAVIETDGEGYDVEGLQSVSYAFGADRRLQVVRLDLSRQWFEALYRTLAEKYEVIEPYRPGGDLFGHFKTPAEKSRLGHPGLIPTS